MFSNNNDDGSAEYDHFENDNDDGDGGPFRLLHVSGAGLERGHVDFRKLPKNIPEKSPLQTARRGGAGVKEVVNFNF